MSNKFIGKIITFCRDARAGVIIDDIGRHYVFNITDWASDASQLQDDAVVEFEARERRAIKVACVSA